VFVAPERPRNILEAHTNLDLGVGIFLKPLQLFPSGSSTERCFLYRKVPGF